MNAFDPFRPTVLPALFYLVAWPLFWLLPRGGGAATPAFFILSSLICVAVVDGPALLLGIAAVTLLSYLAVERVAAIDARQPLRRMAFIALVLGLHAAYWGCFFLPVPDAYRTFVPRPADQGPVMIFFSGIALSFFRIVSFAHDRCAGRIADARLIDFLAYVLFFPQFRHGPIERFANLAPQLRNARRAWRTADLGQGLLRVLSTYAALAIAALAFAGLTYVTGIATRVPDLAAAVRSPDHLGLVDVMVLVHTPVLILYAIEWASASLQLASSRCFGVRGTENFDRLWLATDPVDYWRRWQTTLGAWIQDYAFRPLARATRNTYLAIILACVYCGLLHGPQLRCIAWGVYTGLSVALVSAWQRRRGKGRRKAPPVRVPRIAAVILGRAALFVWMGVGMTILLDPDGCGVPLLARYARLLLGLVGVGA